VKRRKAVKADNKTETEVKAALRQFVQTYTRRDVEGTLKLLAPDPDLLIIGTGPDEKIAGIEQARVHIKRDFEQAGDMSIELGPIEVSAAGPAAWTCTDSTWRVKLGGQEMKYHWRWTMVLEKRQGKWLIVQSHLSAPAQAQAAGESYPAK
jgi:ketosteroid isomerase-like protein